MKDKINIKKLRSEKGFNQRASLWFHQKWNIPQSAYLESIHECQNEPKKIPQWYLAMYENEIVGGLGVIENDFHRRKDLSPNLCALYIEEKYRNQGAAKMLLDCVCRDLSDMGHEHVYLITDHTSFYEKCGWEFLCMVEEEDGNMTRMYRHGLINNSVN